MCCVTLICLFMRPKKTESGYLKNYKIDHKCRSHFWHRYWFRAILVLNVLWGIDTDKGQLPCSGIIDPIIETLPLSQRTRPGEACLQRSSTLQWRSTASVWGNQSLHAKAPREPWSGLWGSAHSGYKPTDYHRVHRLMWFYNHSEF